MLNVNRMSCCQCDAFAHIKVSEERESEKIAGLVIVDLHII